MDVMDASGSSGNDVSRGKDVSIHKVRMGGQPAAMCRLLLQHHQGTAELLQ